MNGTLTATCTDSDIKEAFFGLGVGNGADDINFGIWMESNADTSATYSGLMRTEASPSEAEQQSTAAKKAVW